MIILNIFVLILLILPSKSSYQYNSGKKPMMKADLKGADLDKDMCAPVSDLYCGLLVAVIVDKGDYDFKCVKPCRFFANLTIDQTFECPDMDCIVEKTYEEVSEDQFFVKTAGDDSYSCNWTEGKLCCEYWNEKEKCLSEVYLSPYNY